MPEYGQMDQNMIDALLGQMQDEDPYGTGLQKQTNPYAWVAPGVGGYDAAGGTLGGGSGWTPGPGETNWFQAFEDAGMGGTGPEIQQNSFNNSIMGMAFNILSGGAYNPSMDWNNDGINNVVDIVGSVNDATATGTNPNIPGASDIGLKENVELVGSSPSGVNVYEFDYKDKSYGEGRYRGVVAQEVPESSFVAEDGYLWVNYSNLDVDFEKIA
jgi:hypothetical protein